jgi:hypothetical protein
MVRIEDGSPVGVVDVTTSRVAVLTAAMSGALSGSGDFCQSQNRVSSMISAALQ